MAVIIDIETLPIADVESYVEPAEPAKNLRDPEKIAADIERKQAEQVSRAALYPWTARILALGAIPTDGGPTVHLCQTEDDERAALRWCWDVVVREDDKRFVRPIVGYNSRSFDLPVLMARSLLLGVDFPTLNLDRYRSPHVDLMDRLTWYGVVPARSLKWFARRFGIQVDDAVSGADVAALAAAGDCQAIIDHCLSDLRLTQALAERMGVIRGGRVA